MSSLLIDEVADKYAMHDAYVLAFTNQKEADQLYNMIVQELSSAAEFEVRQFASGVYFVVVTRKYILDR